MAFGRKQEEEIKTAETTIWECNSDSCNAWVRDNFKNEEEPSCPICGGLMESNTKVLQVVENPHKSF
ncbi:cold-shock protein [Bacillus coahuilensis m2-6]|uniref:Cold-shock protein n=1 Tax=Bacillus coahuilensis p1.1.43 TaxID=1150625 RepID=A0A147K881_9BACI|nr:cold-inducible protein YdjO-related protein [Bacillus coahuilensis]KUP06412.1 cold-shock protein [Bacillus coahuilensis p1.1.43]KUP08135.1 cold-shock protein [Bacillus coahuilensis m2-6]